MTKARLAEKLGDICQEHTDTQVAAVEKFRKEHGFPRSVYEKVPEAFVEKELIVVILPIVRDNIHDLKAELRPPHSEEATLEDFYKALEHGIQFSEEHPAWVVGKIPVEPFRHARFLSVDLGTPLCGQA